jgi:subtilisin family serine protease
MHRPGSSSTATRFAAALPVTVLLALLGAGAASAQPNLPTHLSGALGTRVGDHALPHLDSALNHLAAGWSVNPAEAREEAGRRGLELRAGRVHVSVVMQDVPAAEKARGRIPGLGGEVTAHYGRVLDAWIPIGRLAALERLPRVSLVHQPVPPMSLDQAEVARISEKAGTYLTQGVSASNASSWHSAGLTGAGVSVAVIDSFKDAGTAIGLGELPDPTYCYPDCASLNVSSRHGTACAEIVHDMAPGATITLASVATSTDLAQRVGQLAATGADIISVSLGFAEPVPGDGTGPMADAISAARTNHGTLYVGAGGNNANFHWDGTFADTDADDVHNFPGGAEVNILNGGAAIPAGSFLSAYLRWNAWPTTNQDFDLYLVYWTGSTWVIAAGSENVQNGTQPPWEFFAVLAPYTTAYGLVVNKWSATTTPVLDLMAWSRQSLEVKQTARSLVEPATSPDSVTAAAIDADTFALESYSSRGPTHGPGGSLSGGLSQPRLSAFANVDTWSYGLGIFNGTSSATPHIAGAAALVRQGFPASTPGQIQTFLENRAVDQGATGYDSSFGHGRLWLGSPPTVNWTLSVAKAGAGSGTVTSSPAGISCGSDCSQSYGHGTVVQLTATPTAGSTFAGWSGDGDCSDGEVTMTADVSCTAAFDPIPSHLLSASLSGTGSGTVTSSPAGISCGGDCTQSYLQGTTVLLTGTPALGSQLTSWSGDADCSDGLLQMSAATSCTATFDTCATLSEGTLDGISVTSAHTESACTTILVAPTASVIVTGTGELTIRAGNSVVFYSGFSVESGGRLAVVIGQPVL